MTAFTDNFTGTAGAPLSGRPGWTLALGPERFQIGAGGSRLGGTAGSSSAPSYYYAPDPGSANQFVEANVKDTGNGYAIATRMDAGGRNGYGLLVDASGDAVLRRYDNNASITLATIADGITIADVVRLESSDGTHRVFKNGVQIGGDIVDAVHAAGRCGLMHRSANASADHYDNFRSGPLGGVLLAPTSALLPHAATAPPLTPRTMLLPGGAAQATRSGEPALTTRAVLAVLSAWQPQRAGAARLTMAGTIAAIASRTMRIAADAREMRARRP